MATILVSDICKLLNSPVPPGLADVALTGVNTIEEAGPTEVSFVARRKFAEGAARSKAGLILVPQNAAAGVPNALPVPEVWGALLMVLREFFPPSPAGLSIHPTALVGEGCTLGKDVQIGAYCVIGAGTVIGDNARIRPLCCIGKGVLIGGGSLLHDRVTVADGCILGRRVILHSGAVIGSDGFKYEAIKGIPTKIPQVGIVALGDDVEVGANSTIDRASLSRTSIGARTKLDNLVHVGHNVTIGTDCFLVAGVAIGGSTRVGNRVIIAAQVGIKDNITIGDDVKIGPQSGVHTAVPNGAEIIGTPPLPKREWFKMVGLLRQLPNYYERVKPMLLQAGFNPDDAEPPPGES